MQNKRKNYRFCLIIIVVVTAVISLGGFSWAAMKKPKEVKVAMLTGSVKEQPYFAGVVQAFERVQKATPHGLKIKFDIFEKTSFPDHPRVLRAIAKSRKYDIIWSHTAFADGVEPLMKVYPETLWVVSGSGNRALGGSAYWVDMQIHEPAYLLGIMAGMMTKTNIISAVAGYPATDVNPALHAFGEGAKSISPDVKYKITFIESWFDPPKAKEAAFAQIAAGADFVYAERFGPFEACEDKGCYSFGQYIDQNSLSPNVVISSTVIKWDPVVRYIIKEWWNHKTEGTPYNGPKKAENRISFSMAQGGSDIAPYHNLDAKIPQNVKDKVKEVKEKIVSGEIKVTNNEGPISSN